MRTTCLPYLCNPWVGALAVDAVVLQPLALRVRTVLLEGAAVLAFTPHAAKQRISLQTQTAASALGVALVQMDCEGKEEEHRDQKVLKKNSAEVSRRANKVSGVVRRVSFTEVSSEESQIKNKYRLILIVAKQQ